MIAQVSLAALVLVPSRGNAQTAAPDSDSDLLQPSLQGNPNNPPRFKPPASSPTLPADQAPPTGKFTAPSRIGATPIMAVRLVFGAGDTGFESGNRPHRVRVAKTPPKGSELAPAPQTTFENVPAPPPYVPSTAPVLPAPPPPQVYPLKAANLGRFQLRCQRAAFRLWLIGTAQLGYGRADYVGLSRAAAIRNDLHQCGLSLYV